ncbi:hypothetical protein KOW79_013601 [Hemibagrus wyckioides]|uniref:Uncharacterized protein n=1 Tax=Hemibagrus wyckioides TaxID=337641 RepID=A0A9D3NHK4_9TELE|nr:hypothetical protein KOW79_013601 [Hemibagrus wyckioides]
MRNIILSAGERDCLYRNIVRRWTTSGRLRKRTSRRPQPATSLWEAFSHFQKIPPGLSVTQTHKSSHGGAITKDRRGKCG